ncbi:MAG: MBL fold metallo-hydrolase [bacterium]
MSKFRLGDFELYWLNGGKFELDGGAMFGVVPKVLWSKKFPSNDENYIPMVAYPILVKTNDTIAIIESGLGNKLTEKQKQIYRVKEDWDLPFELQKLGFSCEDVSYVILTHFDFDHAGGVVMKKHDGSLTLTFPNAKHILQRKEWDDVIHPNIRSINTFWQINFEILKESRQLELVDGECELFTGLKVSHTGGHNGGHQVVYLSSKGEKALHMGDLMPTHAHYNPLWVMAYDNYPMESIAKKAELENWAVSNHAWLTFYHDPFVLAARFDENGNIIEKWTE